MAISKKAAAPAKKAAQKSTDTTSTAQTRATKAARSNTMLNQQQTISSTDSLKGLDDKKKSASTRGQEHTTKEGPLYKFFLDGLKDVYFAEHRLVEALTKMKEAATTEELQDAFDDHKYMTQKQISRLEKVFNLIGEKAEEKKCDAILGIVSESEGIISSTEEGSMTRDAALIIAAQKAEHYEIASYGGLTAVAHTLGLSRVANLLQTTLDEEEDTDRNLTDIAETSINFEALEDEESEDEESDEEDTDDEEDVESEDEDEEEED